METGRQLQELGQVLETPHYIDEQSWGKHTGKTAVDMLLVDQKVHTLVRLKLDLENIRHQLSQYRTRRKDNIPDFDKR